MLRRRMRYLQEEQEQLQQHQQGMMGENCYHNVSADYDHGLDQSSGDVDGVTRSNCEKGRQYNNISTDGSDDYHDMTAVNEPIITAVPSSKVINATLPMKLNTKLTSHHLTKNYNTINAAVNEVSLESIDEQTILPNQLPPQSNQQLLQYCRENNIPVVTVGAAAAASCKKTWLDFGEDNVNAVGALSTRQFLIYASTRSTALDVVDAPSSVMLEADNCSNNICNREYPINVTLERMSSKEGFICMLHDPSSNNSTSNYDQSSLDPIHFQLKNDETQLINVVWNPIHQGCVRENIGLRINTNAGQVRHGIVLVGSAQESDSTTYVGDSSSNAIIEKEEWNGVSVEYSEIREDGSHHDLEVEGVGLTVTEESIECSSVIATNEVDEIAQMMKNASISPKKASMAAKSLSQLPDPTAQVDFELAVNNRQVDVKQIIAAQEEIDSERLFAEEAILIPQTSLDFVNGLYMNDKVRHLLDDFDAESASTGDSRSGRSTPTFGSLSSEEDNHILSDVSQRLYDEEPIESQVETAEEEVAVVNTDRDVASVVASPDENQHSLDVFNTTTSAHYGKVTAELDALMEDVSDEFKSQSESDSDSRSSHEVYDQSQDEKIGGIFNFDETMSNEENEELNMLPETSIDNSSDWDSSGTDTTFDSDQRRNPYRQMSSDLDALMDEFSELEQFAQMQQDYLISPTTHDFQTQLENINEQIDNLTPSPGNALKTKSLERNMSENRLALRVKETRELKTASEPPTPKDSAKKCYFYKPPPKENNKPVEKSSTLSTQSRDQIEQKRVPYKSPFAAVYEAETSFQSIGSMLDTMSSSEEESESTSKIECDETNSSDGILADSSSLDESISSGESEFDVSNPYSSDDLDDDTSSSLSPSETSSTLPSQNKETNVVVSESLHETRSEQIALMKSKLSFLKVNNNAVSRARQYSSPTKIPQPTSSARKLQLRTPAQKPLIAASLAASASSAQKYKARLYSSPTKIPRPTPSSRKLQLRTPAVKSLDVASLAASTSTAQKSARMTYGHFSQLSNTENSPSDSEMTGMSRLPIKKSLKTPQSKRAPTQLKTPSSMSAYEKHIERMRSSRTRMGFS